MAAVSRSSLVSDVDPVSRERRVYICSCLLITCVNYDKCHKIKTNTQELTYHFIKVVLILLPSFWALSVFGFLPPASSFFFTSTEYKISTLSDFPASVSTSSKRTFVPKILVFGLTFNARFYQPVVSSF